MSFKNWEFVAKQDAINGVLVEPGTETEPVSGTSVGRRQVTSEKLIANGRPSPIAALISRA